MIASLLESIDLGPFTNYVYKRRCVGGQKKSTFCKLLYHRKCKRRGVGGQKKTNLVNVVCERPLIGYILKYGSQEKVPDRLLV